jgi:probable rRNA maturation factor
MPIEIVRRDAGKKVSTRELKKLATKVLALLALDRAELSLALVGNKEIQRLNAKYRKKDVPTDVLAFPSEDLHSMHPPILGDVVISVDKAAEQAKQRSRSLKQELATLLIHGVLHLLGYDHERSAKEARRMRRVEEKIYRALCEQRILRV